MASGPTTICCSAIALTVLLAGGGRAQPPVSDASLFPIHTAWTLALNNALIAPPAYAGLRGFFPIAGDRLVAYELTFGRRLWIAEARPLSTPATGGDHVFVAEADRIRALRQDDGTVTWERAVPDALAAPLVWDNGWLIATLASDAVMALRAADGELVWETSVDSPAPAPPALAADRVYIPTASGRIVALAVATGAVVWERRLGGLPGPLLALEDRIYVGSADNFLYCLDAETGEIAWRWRTGADVIGMPVVDHRRVYFVSLDHVLRALDRTSGAQRWRRGLPVRPLAGPVLIADTLIVSGLAPPPRAYRTRDGAPAGDLPAIGEMGAPPYAIGDAVGPPRIVLVTRDIARGASVLALTRSTEPPVTPLTPLPNPVAPPRPTL